MVARLVSRIFTVTALTLLLPALAHASDKKPASKEGWLEIHSTHFTVYTDAGEKKGREVAVRFEQIRTVFGNLLMRDKLKMPVPLEIVALKNDKDYARVCPVRNGMTISAPAFFVADEDKNLIVLNLFDVEPWRAITHPLAHMLLDGNYPPTQPWFDEGLAEYFASMRVDNRQVEIGGDPQLGSKYYDDLLGGVSQIRNPPRSFVELLKGPLWLNMTDLFQMRLNSPEFQEGTHHSLFYAQSWIVVHYLLKKQLLPQAGTYFDLVQNQKMPVAQAIQQAFGMSSEQFEKTVREYFQSLEPLFVTQDEADQGSTPNLWRQVYEYPVPLLPDDVSLVEKKVEDDDAHALVAEIMVRQPEHYQQGLLDLQALAQEPIDNAVAHRALAFAYMKKKDFKRSSEQLDAAEGYDARDPWVRYYRALLRFEVSWATGQGMEGGLANVQQNLKGVVDWNPEFAEAWNLLGLAELNGGGAHAAADSMRTAIQLSPRNQWYLLNLADIYLSSKKWDDGQAILERLKASGNSSVAASAKKKLADVPFIRKYGISPEQAEMQKKQEQARLEVEKKTEAEDARPQLKERPPDKRRVEYLKGRIVKVDCSRAPAAILTVSSASKTVRLHTDDYKSLVLVGSEAFSCDWQNRPAAVNYKAAGSGEGDLVSVEVQ
jgi:tetratricopeptide (TPR) repeat protein